MSENHCLGYTIEIDGRPFKTSECGNMEQLRAKDARIAALEEQLAAKSQDATVGRAIRTMLDMSMKISLTRWREYDDFVCVVKVRNAPSGHVYIKPSLYDCLVAAELVKEQDA